MDSLRNVCMVTHLMSGRFDTRPSASWAYFSQIVPYSWLKAWKSLYDHLFLILLFRNQFRPQAGKQIA